MSISLIIAVIAAVLALITMIISVVVLVKINGMNDNSFLEYEDAIEKDLSIHRTEINQRLDNMSRNINESVSEGFARIARAEVDSMQGVRNTVSERLGSFEQTIATNSAQTERRLEAMKQSQEEKLDALRETNSRKLTELTDSTNKSLIEGMDNMSRRETESLKKIVQVMGDKLTSFENTTKANYDSLDKRMEAMRKTQEEGLEAIRRATETKLSEIQGTVAEKLDKTLAERVSQSFKNVSDQLEKVYKGLGEMQNLASDVGSLKNALTNVKIRGEMGELQLARILEQMLSAEQYSENVITKPGSKDPVEFAIRIPSKETENEYIWLPVDAKLPLDTYSALCDAYEEGDKAKIEQSRKQLTERVKQDAKNICEKYISPPETTDFAIMFLPTEGLFAEVIRNTPLIEKLRSEYKVTVCGPSTITAFLNSLQMGFRTLTYEKKSSQIARTLSEVKTEFGKFGDSLSKVQKAIESSGKELDTLVGARTRAIQRKLKNIEELPEGEEMKYLTFEEE